MRAALAAFSLLLAAAACPGAEESELWAAYQAKNFFLLKGHLPAPSSNQSARVEFLRAATAASFGEHETAIALLRGILSKAHDPDLDVLTRGLLMHEERARYRYKPALEAIEPLLRESRPKDPGQLVDLRNSARFLTALAGVGPQQVLGNAHPLVVQRGPDGRFAVLLGGHAARLGFDTGASFSFLAESTARQAGLEILRSDVSVSSPTGADVQVALAVGEIAIGSLRIRNVVFLVMPDARLTMPDGFFMPGLLGFPVISALGAISYERDGSMQIGVRHVAREPNLALDGNRVVALVEFRKQKLLCQLDTGADNTVFYERFYQLFPDLFADPSRGHPLKLGGAAGVQEIPAYPLESIDFKLADEPIHLTGTQVFEKSIVAAQDNYLACNIGLDALKSFKSYSIDLKALRLELHG